MSKTYIGYAIYAQFGSVKVVPVTKVTAKMVAIDDPKIYRDRIERSHVRGIYRTREEAELALVAATEIALKYSADLKAAREASYQANLAYQQLMNKQHEAERDAYASSHGLMRFNADGSMRTD